MKLVACGLRHHAFDAKEFLKDTDYDLKYFVEIIPEDKEHKILRHLEKLINNKDIDGILFVLYSSTTRLDASIKFCKEHAFPNIGVLDLISVKYLYDPKDVIRWLNPTKNGYITYMETNIIDSCNLNCKGCSHFAPLFTDKDFYDIKEFTHDVQRISEKFDVTRFRLLGGEPLKKHDLADYIKVSAKYLPPHLLKIIRENKIIVDISMYPPTEKIFDQISDILNRNEIKFIRQRAVNFFSLALTLNSGHDKQLSRVACTMDQCRLIRDGKFYKCPFDALIHRYKQFFNIDELPTRDSSVDIYNPDVVTLLDGLEGNIELCGYCNELARQIPWQASNNHRKEDWIF